MNDRWVGLFEVAPSGDDMALDGDIGAFVTAVGLAYSIEQFTRRVCAKLENFSLAIIDIDYIDLIENQEDTDLNRRLTKLPSDEYPVQFGTFDTYDTID